nr:MAG TPA: hypothetical protein [Caudoviricetes sp.]
MGSGLLAGFGRGLSQGAAMLQQGMAEDRAVKREDEREKMRQASIERRWKVEDERYEDQKKRQDSQDQKADSRYKDEVKWRKEQSDKQDNQFNVQIDLKRKEQIEQNLSGIIDSLDKSEAKIESKYRDLILSGQGDPKALQAQMESEISSLRQSYQSRLDGFVKSYGASLKGTGFEHLLDLGEPTSELQPQAGAPQDPKKDRLGIIRDYVGKNKSTPNGLADFANQYNNRNTKPTIGQQAAQLGLLQQAPLNQGLSYDDLGQFATWATRK